MSGAPMTSGRKPMVALGMLVLALLSVSAATPAAAVEQGALWAALREGRAFAMIRHALAPGTGDPTGFRIGDCATQRNLSDEGRNQSRRIGDLFRANGIAAADVVTSQWCRCRETADLLGLGPPTDLPALNSFFGNMEDRAPQTRELRAWLDARSPSRPLVMVTHQVNISALTGRSTSSGEVVVVSHARGGDPTVLGSIPTR